MKIKRSENEPKSLFTVQKSPAIVCSCMLEPLEPAPVGKAGEGTKHAVLINRLEAEEICFEAKERFNTDYLYKLNFSPVGGMPFSVIAKILEVSESYRKGFYFNFAKFENLTPSQQQSVLALMASASIAGMSKPVS